ncbi:chlorophyll A/B binding protein 13, chloroplastic [Tanacetum coccineum]
MSKLYTCIWNEMSISKQKIVENLNSQAFIFIPHSHASTNEVVVGLFLSPNEVYWQWHDPIVSLMEQTNSPDSQSDQSMTHRSLSNRLCDVYPGLHDFFVNELGVAENPPLRIYLPSLIQCLSTGSLPSQAVKTIVTREAVYYGQTDNNSKASLINSVLPYAQRYIYSVHPDVYDVLKCSWGLKHPSCLRVVEVKKLAYINVIKKCGIKSNKRIKSNCLLQDGILYTTNESDTHLLFRELSRFLLAGFPELPLANFLQMIMTMTQSGNPASTSTIPSVILEEDEASKEVLDSVIDMNAGFKGQLDDGKNISPLSLKHAITGSTGETGGTGERNGETGRTGELVAFKYFSAKLGEDCVKWVNEIKESGLPYDIVIEGSDNSKEYIEVKATSHAWKDWFRISVKEWDFAREKGDSFCVARVVILDGNSAQVTTLYEIPSKLCQLKQLHLQLALLQPKQ